MELLNMKDRSSISSKVFAAFVALCVALSMTIGAGLAGAKSAYASSNTVIGTPAISNDEAITTMEEPEGALATFKLTGTNHQEEARSILSLVNGVRALDYNPTEEGGTKTPTAPLTWDYELEKAAMQRAAEIAIYFEHVRPNGTSCFTVFPAGYNWQGENIFAGQGARDAANANLNWTNSPDHYKNMIKGEFTCMAAASFEINGNAYWVELFGNPNQDPHETPSFNAQETYTIEVAPTYATATMNDALVNDAAIGTKGEYVISHKNSDDSASFLSVNIDPTSFNWTSSEPSAITVNEHGVATVVGTGVAKITATNKTLESLTFSQSVAISNNSSSTSTNNGSSSSASAVQGGSWVKSGNRWWYKNGDGTFPTGIQSINGKKYYFDAEGWMKTGWVDQGGTWYYFNGDGAMATGWKKLGGKWYYLNSNGAMLTGKQTIDNTPYFFADNGALHTGWVGEGADWYYYTANGVMATGWQKIGGKWYFMNTNGKMATQWVADKGKNYYMNYPSGDMAIGWKQIGDFWYYFNGDGSMATGWKKLGGTWYYLNSAGVMTSDDIVGINDKLYHFNASGAMTTGWLEAEGYWYYFSGSGAALQDQWLKSGGKWYYFASDYLMWTGLREINGKYYCFNYPNGDMVTGWKEMNGKWRYFDGSGVMQVNKWIGGKFYVDANGIMATDQWIGDYYVDAKGYWVPGATHEA